MSCVLLYIRQQSNTVRRGDFYVTWYVPEVSTCGDSPFMDMCHMHKARAWYVRRQSSIPRRRDFYIKWCAPEVVTCGGSPYMGICHINELRYVIYLMAIEYITTSGFFAWHITRCVFEVSVCDNLPYMNSPFMNSSYMNKQIIWYIQRQSNM